MFRCLSHKAALSLTLGAVLLFVAGCESQRPTLMCFTATWCGPCQVDHPKIDRIQHSGRVIVKVYDVDKPDCPYKGNIPYYEYYAPNGKIKYRGHDIDKVKP